MAGPPALSGDPGPRDRGLRVAAPAGGPSDEPLDRRQLRELARRFTQREITPHLPEWERAGRVPRTLHAATAKVGLLGAGFPEEVGGSGGDFLDYCAVAEEIILAGGSSGLFAALFTHSIAVPHMITSRDPRLVDGYVRPTLAGEKIGSLAITEPDGGSDVAAVRTTARRDGDHFVVNGTKIFITSGVRADFVTTLVRTGGSGRAGVSLLVVDADAPGFTVGRELEKLGWHCSDTAELSFVDVPVPAGNLVGAPGTGLAQLMRHFATERISMAVQACATAQRCLDLTIHWCRHRSTFGEPLAGRQVIRHRLAEMARVTQVARTFVWQVAARVAGGDQRVTDVAMAKNTAASACAFVVDEALQLHGGAGYLRDSEVERHYRDSRIMSIGGGTSEMMNEIIVKGLGL
ncbi:acyl-CoA dehydrogenase family protein [Plantactinospora sp. WMMB334]|uniref:acyl-CoA dehydrogenase family protein n=1 Tax=Plantactinospora sp. WMMB334 TaxID=3404119 RepID=UPI003B931086